MTRLYQYGFGSQPHYVVAESYADAEATIRRWEGFNSTIVRIDCLGPYVLVSESVLMEAQP